MRLRKSALLAFAAGTVLALGLNGARAADGLAVELNKLEATDGACRVYMVFANKTGQALSSYKPDLVFFDKDGVIAERLVVEGGPLPAGKTKVKLFDVAGLDCGAVGRVLLNDVSACQGPDGPIADCLAATNASSKGDVDFIK